MMHLLTTLIFTVAPLNEHFACNLNALTREERATHQRLGEALRNAVREQKELRNGYAFRLRHDALTNVAQWVALESRCCPFFTFAIEIDRDQGPVWLRITGSLGVKKFMREELGLS